MPTTRTSSIAHTLYSLAKHPPDAHLGVGVQLVYRGNPLMRRIRVWRRVNKIKQILDMHSNITYTLDVNKSRGMIEIVLIGVTYDLGSALYEVGKQL